MARSAPSTQSNNVVLDSLPCDQLLEAEESLREGMLNFLAQWMQPELATVTDLECDPSLQGIREQFLPPDVPLLQWIRHRVGEEFVIAPDGTVHLEGDAKETVAEMAMELHGMQRPSGEAAGGKTNVGKACGKTDGAISGKSNTKAGRKAGGKAGGKAANGKLDGKVWETDSVRVTLPANTHVMTDGKDTLPHAVIPFRKALENARRMHPEAFSAPMKFTELLHLMQTLGERFHVGEMSHLAEKLLNRGKSPSAFLRFYCSDLVLLKAGDVQTNFYSKPEQTKRKTAFAEEAIRNRDVIEFQDKDDFFATLPTGTMTPAEWSLHDALLKWMRKQRAQDSEKQLLMDDFTNEIQGKTLTKFLERGHASLQDWIERRAQSLVVVGMDEHDRIEFFPAGKLKSLRFSHAQEPRAKKREFIAGESQPTQHNSDVELDPELAAHFEQLKRIRQNPIKSAQDFLDRLPKHRFSPAEKVILDAILEFDGQSLSRVVSRISKEKQMLQREICDVLEDKNKFPFRKWVETRLQNYIVVKGKEPGGFGEPIMHVVGDTRTRPAVPRGIHEVSLNGTDGKRRKLGT